MIGGLGSDIVNVGSDVVGDVFARDIEGTSGTVNHLVTSNDPNYNGLVVNGVDLSVARPGQGQVIVNESDGFSALYEGGSCFSLTPVGCVSPLDSYTVVLAAAPTANVYVTVSAAGSPQEESTGDTFLVSTIAGSPADFYRTITLNGVPTTVPKRSIVLVFTPGNWNVPQTVFMYAVDDALAEGNRTVTASQSVISTDASFDGAIVRNVEVTIYDNDAPGVLVTPLDPATSKPDNATTVLEGTNLGTEVTDVYAIQLTSSPAAGKTVTVRISPSSNRVCLAGAGVTAAVAFGDPTLCPVGGDTYTVTFNQFNWFIPVMVTVHARNDFAAEDPQAVALVHTIDPTTTDPSYLATAPGGSAQEILQRIYATVIDDDSPGVFVNQSGGSTLVTLCGNALCTIPGPGDSYTLRLTSQPTDTVQVAIITDGQTDATGLPTAKIGGLRPTQLFAGNITVSGSTITRAAGSDLGSFVDEGFVAGMRIRIGGTGTGDDADFFVLTVTPSTLTLTTAPPTAGTFNGVTIASLTEQGTYTGTTGHAISYDFATGSLTRTDGTSWLDSGFLEGQLIKISGDPTLYKINSFSSSGGGNLNVLTLTSTAKPASVRLDGLRGSVGRGRHLHAGELRDRADGQPARRPELHPAARPPEPEDVLEAAAHPERHPGPAVGRGWHDELRPLAARRGPAAGRGQRPTVRRRRAAARVAADRHPQRLRRRQQAGPDRDPDLDRADRPVDGWRPGRDPRLHVPAPARADDVPVRRAGRVSGRHQLRHGDRRPEHAHVLDRRQPDDHRGPEHPPRPGQRPPDDRQHDGARPRPQPGRDAEPRSRTRWRHGRPRRRRRAPDAHRHVRCQQHRFDGHGPAARRAVLVGRGLCGRPADHVHRRAVGHVHDRRLRQLELRPGQRAPPQRRTRDDRPRDRGERLGLRLPAGDSRLRPDDEQDPAPRRPAVAEPRLHLRPADLDRRHPGHLDDRRLRQLGLRRRDGARPHRALP